MLRRMRAPALAVFALALGSAGCPNTDPAIFVDADLGAPVVGVEQGVLGASLSGTFTLVLHLGARASGASDVTFGTFSLQTADQSTTIVEVLPVVASQSSPVTVEPDSTVEITFEITTGEDVLDAAIVDQICAGQVVVSGVIEDSLEGESSPVVSPAATPVGCE